MNINIKAKNLELTPAIAQYIQNKVDMLEKYLGNLAVINCDFEVEKSVGGQNKGEIFRAEINLQIPRELLRVEKTEADMYKAIDKVKDHVEQIIIDYKAKIRDKKRRR